MEDIGSGVEFTFCFSYGCIIIRDKEDKGRSFRSFFQRRKGDLTVVNRSHVVLHPTEQYGDAKVLLKLGVKFPQESMTKFKLGIPSGVLMLESVESEPALFRLPKGNYEVFYSQRSPAESLIELELYFSPES